MDSAPYLQDQDRPEFEHILGELLNHEDIRLALRRAPGGPTGEQLHSRALRDSLTISANVSAEYAYYCELREQVRGTIRSGISERLGGNDPAQWQAPEGTLDAAERAGWVPLLAVLLPILSGLGAIVMLLLGYLLRAEHVSLGQPLVTAGFVSAVFCATAIAVDIIGLLLTAARDAATPPDGHSPDLYAELAKARDSWRLALRDHALLPYLLAQLGASKQQVGVDYGAAAQPVGVSLVRARPRLGFSSPGFTSPGPERITDGQGRELEADPDAEPHYSSPGFTSPGPERITDGQGRELEADPDAEPHYSSPGFTSPGPERITDGQGRELEADPDAGPHYSSPGFTRPNFTAPDFTSPGGFDSGRPAVPTPRPPVRPRSRFLPNEDDLDAEAADLREDAERD